MRKFLSLMMAAFFSVGMFASTYTVAGSSTAILGSSWDPADASNDMTLVDGVYTLVKENVNLFAATYEYKVVKDHAWANGAWPNANATLVIAEDGKYNVTFTFVESTKAVNAVAEKTGSAVVEHHYLVVGDSLAANGKSWNNDAAVNLMTSADNGLTYTLTIENVQLTANVTYGYKIVEKGSWTEYYPNAAQGANATFTVAETAKYTIKYTYTVATAQCAVQTTKTGDAEQVETLAVYFVNVPGWEAVKAYAWKANGEKNADWPGEAMTKTATQVNGKDMYSCTIAADLETIIFNNGTSGEGNQTGDLAIDATKPYFYDGAWYASVEAIPAGQGGEGGEGGEQGGEGESTTYYLKNNWGGGDNQWTWKAMTPAENNTYKLENVVFGGAGVNYSATENADAPEWVPVDQFDGDEVGEKDTVTFVLDLAAAKKIKATLLGKYVAEQGGEGQGGEGGEQTEDNVTVYFVNALNWQNVGAHVWNEAGVSYKNWPGEAMTKTQNQVNSKDIYSYTFPASYTHVIFNSFVAEGAQQTSDLTVQAGKYFYLDSWYASIEDIPAPGELTYYMRTWAHSFEWAWEQMSPGENGTFVIDQTVYGGIGFYYNTIADRAGEVEATSITVAQGEQLHDYDTIAIVLNPATGAVNVTIIGHYVPDYLRVYCNADHNDWNAYGAATTAIYLYGNYYPNYGWPGERMHAVEGEANMYYYDVDRNLYSKIIFTRVNKNDCTISDQDCAYYWGGKTGDLDIPTDEKTMYTITAYTDGQETSTQGAWSVKGGGDIPQPTLSYYLIGSDEAIGGANWDGSKAVALENGSATVTLAAGACEFKVVPSINGEWDWTQALAFADVDTECSSAGVVEGTSNGNVMVTLAAAGNMTVAIQNGKLCVTGTFVVPETMKYYLVGTMTEWAVVKEDQYLFSETVVPGEYMLHTTLTVGQGIKVVGVLGEQQTWYIEGEGNEYQVDAAHAGAAVIYFRPAGNTEWSDLDGHIYVAMDEQTGIQNTVSEQKVVKFIENGQLFLLINGTVYTTTGAIR